MAANTIELEGISAQMKQFEKLMTTDARMRENVRLAIRKVLKEVRNKLSSDAREGLGMKSDPRKAYKAVRYAVYKLLLGGNVNILQRRKAGRPTNYQKPKKGLPSRGGNRWGRSERTIALEGYEGVDRGFILRFLNAGTADRAIRTFADKSGNSHSLRSGAVRNIKTRGIGGNRGSIAARNWFGNASQSELMAAAEELQNLIYNVIEDTIL